MGIFGRSDDTSELEKRITRLEGQVQQLTQLVHSLTSDSAPGTWPAVPSSGNLAEQPDWLFEVRSLLAQGKKIDAIKRAREAAGLGLKEAKDYVEGL